MLRRNAELLAGFNITTSSLLLKSGRTSSHQQLMISPLIHCYAEGNPQAMLGGRNTGLRLSYLTRMDSTSRRFCSSTTSTSTSSTTSTSTSDRCDSTATTDNWKSPAAGGRGGGGDHVGLLFQANDQYEMFTEEGRPRNMEVKSWKETLMMVGMPAGYPQSVRPGYRRFFHLAAASACVAAFASQIGTQSLLTGFFSGSSAGSWILKDLAPTLLAATIANAITSYGTKAKMWYIVAMGLSQGANVIEFCIPHLLGANNFLVAATATSLLKGSAGLVFGITRATLVQNYAWNHNIGEVMKKTVTVGMVVWTLFGALGLAFAKAVPDPTIQFGVVVVSAFFCTILTWYNVSHIAFSNLTPVTGRVIMDDFLKDLAASNEATKKKENTKEEEEARGVAPGCGGGRGEMASCIPTPKALAKELGVMGEPGAQRNLSYAGLMAVNPPLNSLDLGDGKVWVSRANHLRQMMHTIDQEALDAEMTLLVDGEGKKAADSAAAPSSSLSGSPKGSTSRMSPRKLGEERSMPFMMGVYSTHRIQNPAMQAVTGKATSGPGVPKVVVIFEKDAKLVDVLQAMLLCSHVARTTATRIPMSSSSSLTSSSLVLSEGQAAEMDELLSVELQLVRLRYWRKQAVALLAQLREAGWDLHGHAMDSRNRRFSFKATTSSEGF